MKEPIVTGNNLDAVSEPLKFRLKITEFSESKDDVQEMKAQIISRIKKICTLENVDFDETTAKQFVDENFPDIRKTIIEADSKFSE